MDWNEVPEGVGGKAEIAIWHDIIEERISSAPAGLPTHNVEKPPPNVLSVSQSAMTKGYQVVEFTQHVR